MEELTIALGGMEIIRGRHCRFMSEIPQTDKLQVSGLDDMSIS